MVLISSVKRFWNKFLAGLNETYFIISRGSLSKLRSSGPLGGHFQVLNPKVSVFT